MKQDAAIQFLSIDRFFVESAFVFFFCGSCEQTTPAFLCKKKER